MTEDTRLSRVQALTANARNTWFILLAVLIFVGVTMLGVRPIDFYGVSRDTELPLVGVAVPTRLFFYAAPVLTVAVYGYFHLYLIRLWDILGALPPRIEGRPLGDAISPWLVTDTALTLRRRLRGDGCCTPRALEFPSVFWNIVFAWLAGPLVLGYVWYQSLPARDLAMTGVAAAMVVFSIIFGLGSAVMVILRMRRPSGDPARQVQMAGLWNILIWVLAALLIGTLSWSKTEGSREHLARLDLTAENIVKRPTGWATYDLAQKDFFATWCAREATSCDLAELSAPDRNAFVAEWEKRRAATMADLQRPLWHEPGRPKPDLRDAELSSTFLAGANLDGAQMSGSQLVGANLEGSSFIGADLHSAKLHEALLQETSFATANLESAQLSFAQMRKATFVSAKLKRAVLSGTFMQDADFTATELKNADLSYARMHGTILDYAALQEANLAAAQMQGAYLRKSKMQRANLNGSQLQNAQMQQINLTAAQLRETNLRWAHMQGSILNFSQLTGSRETINVLYGTNLMGSKNHGGMLRFVDITAIPLDVQTDFRNVFLDGSVLLSRVFSELMGFPCQWIGYVIANDNEFFGRWRGWVEAAPPQFEPPTWNEIAPEGFEDVAAIPPPPGCTWKTGPMPE